MSSLSVRPQGGRSQYYLQLLREQKSFTISLRVFDTTCSDLMRPGPFVFWGDMSNFTNAVDELEVAIRSGLPGRRTEVLRRVTSLFLNDVTKLNQNQVSLFGDVMTRLVEEIETGAMMELSIRLAPISQAPHSIVRKLASVDAIEVAGPILERSDRLTDQDLVEIATTKGQSHQLRIAARSRLSEVVTEALIDRCDLAVANRVAGNSGARISGKGFSKLAMIAVGDEKLTETMVQRADVPPQLFRELLCHATDTVKKNLLTAAPAIVRERLLTILNEISEQMSSRVAADHYAEAWRSVSAFSQDTSLCRKKLLEFAKAKILGKTVVTLSLLSAVLIDLVDRLMHDSSPYGIMTLCKVLGFEWSVSAAILGTRPVTSHGCTSADLSELQIDYERLTTSLAQRLLRFWQCGQASTAIR